MNQARSIRRSVIHRAANYTDAQVKFLPCFCCVLGSLQVSTLPGCFCYILLIFIQFLQVKVREATSNDPWGPSSTMMSEIADLTYNVVAFTEIMQMIWKRLNDHGKNWRHVYKALVLLEYLIKTGSEKVAQQCKENIYAIQTLKDFQYLDDNKDQGINVREKAKTLVALLKDDERLRNERVRALKAKERFAQSAAGIGSDTVVSIFSKHIPF